MISISDLDLDTVVREIAETPPPPEPSRELVAKCGAYLERRGWLRAMAGDADFAAASARSRGAASSCSAGTAAARPRS